jgi:predicted Fe-Mo cluster-binding NifX family protein
VADLEALKIEILICSAISVEAEAAMRVAGIEVVPEICGPVDTIVKALAAGDRKLAGFHSPAGRSRGRGRGLEAATRAVPQRPARRVTVASPVKGGRK